MVLNVPGQLFDTAPVTVTGYRSQESGQLETLKFYRGSVVAYETVYTVTEGKTFNVTHIIITNTGTGRYEYKLATGTAGSEVDIMVFDIDNGNPEPTQVQLQVPIKFTSGTRISIYNPNATYDVVLNLIGFEE